MASTTKSRVLSYYSGVANYKEVITDPFTGRSSTNVDNKLPYAVEGRQYTVSEENPIFWEVRKLVKEHERMVAHGQTSAIDSLNRLRNLDVGGDFYTTKRHSGFSSPMVRLTAKPPGLTSYQYNGPLFAHTPRVAWNSPVWPGILDYKTELDLCYMRGATAIARTAPTVPVVSVANLLGELKADGLPSLLLSTLKRGKSLKQRAKGAGSDYLNFEFGWKPLVSDILEISKTVVKAEKLLQQYEARSGQPIGRKYSFPEELSTSVQDLGLATPDFVLSSPVYISSQGRKSLEISSSRKYWFEGVYSYHLPTATDSRGKLMGYASSAEHLLGLKITPEVLWNLQPWSWFADWFFNLGSIAANLGAFSQDDLMLRRGYIMCESTVRHTYTNSGVDLKGYGPTGPLTQWFESKTKTRRKASPWGFGVTFSSFSAKQIAIMSALGVSRMR